jgi:hypothetical protein
MSYSLSVGILYLFSLKIPRFLISATRNTVLIIRLFLIQNIWEADDASR